MSHRLYVDYRSRGLTFIKGSNSAVLARNVDVVCLTFVTGILMPLATIASEATLFLLLFGGLALYNAAAAGLILVIFLPAAWSYYALVRNRLDRYGEIENRAHREKARTVIETFRGYPDIEINNAFPQMLRSFDRAMTTWCAPGRSRRPSGYCPRCSPRWGCARAWRCSSWRASGPRADRCGCCSASSPWPLSD